MKLTAFFLLAVLVSFAACERNTDQGLIFSHSIQIAKKIHLYSGQPGGSDTLTITEYRYDGQGRMVEIVDSTRTPVTHQNVTTTKFYYRGSDELPYERIAFGDYIDGTKYRDTTFFWYENGVVSADSTITDIDYLSPYVYKSTHIVTAQTIINSGNRTTSTIKRYDLSYPPNISVCESKTVSDKVYLNGNISSEQVTTTPGISCGGSTASTKNIQIFYDDKPSCFKGIPPVYPSLSAGFSYYLQQNNMVEHIDAGGHTKRTYTYRVDGFPVSYLSQTVGSSIVTKTLIFYRE